MSSSSAREPLGWQRRTIFPVMVALSFFLKRAIELAAGFSLSAILG